MQDRYLCLTADVWPQGIPGWLCLPLLGIQGVFCKTPLNRPACQTTADGGLAMVPLPNGGHFQDWWTYQKQSIFSPPPPPLLHPKP